MDQTVTCQICREPMQPRPSTLGLGPGEWRPSDDRIAAILSEVYECARCGRMTIRPGAVTSLRSRAA